MRQTDFRPLHPTPPNTERICNNHRCYTISFWIFHISSVSELQRVFAAHPFRQLPWHLLCVTWPVSRASERTVYFESPTQFSLVTIQFHGASMTIMCRLWTSNGADCWRRCSENERKVGAQRCLLMEQGSQIVTLAGGKYFVG